VALPSGRGFEETTLRLWKLVFYLVLKERRRLFERAKSNALEF
jgi:hypothetical protein